MLVVGSAVIVKKADTCPFTLLLTLIVFMLIEHHQFFIVINVLRTITEGFHDLPNC